MNYKITSKLMMIFAAFFFSISSLMARSLEAPSTNLLIQKFRSIEHDSKEKELGGAVSRMFGFQFEYIGVHGYRGVNWTCPSPIRPESDANQFLKWQRDCWLNIHRNKLDRSLVILTGYTSESRDRNGKDYVIIQPIVSIEGRRGRGYVWTVIIGKGKSAIRTVSLPLPDNKFLFSRFKILSRDVVNVYEEVPLVYDNPGCSGDFAKFRRLDRITKFRLVWNKTRDDCVSVVSRNRVVGYVSIRGLTRSELQRLLPSASVAVGASLLLQGGTQNLRLARHELERAAGNPLTPAITQVDLLMMLSRVNAQLANEDGAQESIARARDIDATSPIISRYKMMARLVEVSRLRPGLSDKRTRDKVIEEAESEFEAIEASNDPWLQSLKRALRD